MEMNDITAQMKAMQMSACTAMNHPKKDQILFRQKQREEFIQCSVVRWATQSHEVLNNWEPIHATLGLTQTFTEAREMLSRRLEYRVHFHVQSLEFTLFLHYYALE